MSSFKGTDKVQSNNFPHVSSVIIDIKYSTFKTVVMHHWNCPHHQQQHDCLCWKIPLNGFINEGCLDQQCRTEVGAKAYHHINNDMNIISTTQRTQRWKLYWWICRLALAWRKHCQRQTGPRVLTLYLDLALQLVFIFEIKSQYPGYVVSLSMFWYWSVVKYRSGLLDVLTSDEETKFLMC